MLIAYFQIQPVIDSLTNLLGKNGTILCALLVVVGIILSMYGTKQNEIISRTLAVGLLLLVLLGLINDMNRMTNNEAGDTVSIFTLVGFLVMGAILGIIVWCVCWLDSKE